MFNITSKTTLRDLGYNAAATGDTLQTIADELKRRYPNGLTDEAVADVQSGMVARKHELVGEIRYLVEGGVYTKIGLKDKVADDAVMFTITVNYADALTPYEFGQLKKTNLTLYNIILPLRTAKTKYVSNRYNKLVSLMKDEKTGTRNPNKAFAEWIGIGDKCVIQTMLTRQKTAIKNGDETAPRNKDELKKMICAAIDKA